MIPLENVGPILPCRLEVQQMSHCTVSVHCPGDGSQDIP